MKDVVYHKAKPGIQVLFCQGIKAKVYLSAQKAGDVLVEALLSIFLYRVVTSFLYLKMYNLIPHIATMFLFRVDPSFGKPVAHTIFVILINKKNRKLQIQN